MTLKDKSSYDIDDVDDIKMYLNDSKVKETRCVRGPGK